MKKTLSTKLLHKAALFGAALMIAGPVMADPFLWTGSSGSGLNWITPGNWSPNGPPGANDSALFLDQGATNNATSINNIVSSDALVQSIWVGPTNGSTTNTEAFNTLISPGQMLTVAGTSALDSLDSYENAGSTTNPATYLVGTLDYAAVDTTVTNTVSGTGGALILDNTNNILSVREGNGSSGSHIATLDLSGLDTFSANLAGIQVGVGDHTYRRAIGNLYLAKTNVITVRGSDDTPGMFIGDNGGNNDANSSHSDLYLGQDNVINADWIRIGGQKQQGQMYFETGLTSPTLKLRGSDGVSPVTNIGIGDDHYQGSSGNPTTGTVDLSDGTVDILADIVYVGRSQTGDGREAVGNLTLGDGTFNVNDLELGYEDTSSNTRQEGDRTAEGNLTLNGTTVTVNDMLQLGRDGGATPTQIGTITMSGGTLTDNGSFSIEGTAQLDIENNAVLDLPPHSSILASAVTVDSGGLITNVDVLQATNALLIANGGTIASPKVFNMGIDGYSAWDVSGTASGGLTVSNEFSGAGYFNGDLTMASGSTLVPGGEGLIQPLYLYNNLALNGSTLKVDLSSSGSSGNDEIDVYGNLSLGATNQVWITPLDGSLDTANPYTLITDSSLTSGDQSYFHVTGPVAKSRYTFSFSTATPGMVQVMVGGSGPANLVWAGDGSANNWDVQSTADWNNGGSADKFYSLDSVTFDDTGSASPAVNLVGTLYPGSIAMNNNSKAYTFGGTGSLNGSLTNYGSGGLTISNDGTNNFTSFDLESGNVTFAGNSANNVGSGGLLVDSSSASATIANTNENDFGPAGVVLNGGDLTFDQPADATFDSPISGTGTVTKQNTNTLTMSGDNSGYSDGISVAGGTLRVGSSSMVPAGGLTVQNGGTLDVNGNDLSDSSIDVTASGAGANGMGAIVNNGPDQVYAFSALNLDGDTTFGGTGRWDIRGSSSTPALLNLNGGGYNITKVGTNEFALVYAAVDPTLGNVDVKEGEFAIQTTTAENGGVGDPTKTITVYPGAMLETYGLGADYPLDKLISVQDGGMIQNDHDVTVLSGAITVQGNALINVNHTFIFSNSVGGSGGLTKMGGSTLVLSGACSYSGATTVTNGTLEVDGSIAGSGVEVNGGTLAGVGSVSAPVLVDTNGILSPGTNGIGTLSVAANLSLLGTASMDLSKTNGVLTNDMVTSVNQLTLGGTLQLNLSGDALADGDSFKLFSAANISGAFAQITPATPGQGLAWDTSNLAVNGTLAVMTSQLSTVPTNITVTVSGGNLTLSWPVNHLGWTLQAQTNSPGTGLGTNWVDVPGSAGVDSMNMPVGSTNGSVFYRLIYRQ